MKKILTMIGFILASTHAMADLAKVNTQTPAFSLDCMPRSDLVDIQIKGKMLGNIYIYSARHNSMQMSLSKQTNIQLQLDKNQLPANISYIATPDNLSSHHDKIQENEFSHKKEWVLNANCQLH